MSHRNTLLMDNFVKQGSGLFAHQNEVHVQQGYEETEIRELIKGGNFSWVECLDLTNLDSTSSNTDRYLFIAQKQ